MRITYEDVVLGFKRAVEAKGEDYVYDGVSGACSYFEPVDQTPSCLVGHVLADLGYTAEDLVGYNYSNVTDLVRERVLEVDRNETLVMLRRAQNLQDTGSTWGVAVERATTPIHPNVTPVRIGEQ